MTKHDCLVEGTRHSISGEQFVETVHAGSIYIASGRGQTISQIGDPDTTTPLRSTSKAFQLLPLLIAGLHRSTSEQKSVLSDTQSEARADLAVMMSSHSGEKTHTDRIEQLLHRNGLGASALQCGTHEPIDRQTSRELIRNHAEPTVLHCNCSGKHTGMLLVCQAHGWDEKTYLDIDHPLQRQIRELIESLGNATSPLPFVTDGCSLPTFVVSLRFLARLFACMALPSVAASAHGEKMHDHLQLLFEVACQHPHMIAGSNRLDTQLMTACDGQVFAKTGADGVYALAIKPNDRFPDGLAVAIKVCHNDSNSSIRRMVAIEVLRQCGVAFDPEKLPTHSDIYNNRGLHVGQLRTCFTLPW